jgi:hypothetical protein
VPPPVLDAASLLRELNRVDENDVRRWPKVTHDYPCPACDGRHFETCRFSPGGTFAACGNSGVGSWGVVLDVSWKEPVGWLHPVAARVALVDGRRLPLLDVHLNELRASGLSDEAIRAAGFYTEARPWHPRTALGWERYGPPLGPALMIPCLNGKTCGYCRLKPLRPRKDAETDRLVKYEAPAARSPRSYVPPGTLAALADPTRPLLITEGEKKAAKADQEGFPCVGLSGVYSWQKAPRRDEFGLPYGERQLLDDLDTVAWAGRVVTICFDSDAATNGNILDAEQRLCQHHFGC